MGGSKPQQDNFSNVSWSDHVHEQQERAIPPAEEPGHTLDGPGTALEHEPNALGHEKLRCVVGAPLKESDGTKDVFVSYLITTHVCALRMPPPSAFGFAPY